MPLLGAVGGASEYSWRGTLDDWPDDFSFTNITNATPGLAYTTGITTITGLNNRAKVTVGTGFSVSVNGGAFSTSPQFIENNDYISVSVQTSSGIDDDFFKTYSTNVRVGKKFSEWRIVTRAKDATPQPFAFDDSSNLEISSPASSNIVTLGGLEPVVPTQIIVTSGISSVKINSGSPVYSGLVLTGDTIQMVGVSSSLYDKRLTTEVLVGTYSTTYSIITREADTSVDQFSFTNVINATPDVSYESNSITLSGADNNVEMDAIIDGRGAFFKVQRVLPVVGLTTIKSYSNTSTVPFKVLNGDIITLSLLSTTEYSTTNTCTLRIVGKSSTTSASYSVTTRVPIVDTIPDRFKFTDLNSVDRDKDYYSNTIELTGMTPGDEAVASITSPGKFRVQRLNASSVLETVRDYSSDNYNVKNGDRITLQVRSSPASNGEVQTSFSVTGSDNRNLNSIFSETITDNWFLSSAVRYCVLNPFSFTNMDDVPRNTLQKERFVVSGPAESDCNLRVSTSNQNSYLLVNGATGNNIPVGIGTTVEVFMASGDYSEVRNTVVSILTANGNVTSAQWTISTIPDKTPAIRLSSSTSQVPFGGTIVLTWTSEYADSVTSNFGVGSGQTEGSIIISEVTQSKIYTITAYGGGGGSKPASVTVPIQTITNAQISASPLSVPFGGNVSVSWSTQNATSVRSNFGVVDPSGQTTIQGITTSRTFTIVGLGPSGESPEASVTVSSQSCQVATQNLAVDSGINALSTLGENGQYYFTSLNGSNVNNPIKTSNTSSENVVDFTTPGANSWIVPNGVTSVTALCIGGGGGGGTSINDTGTSGGGGGGGGGIKRGLINVTPGETITINVGAGGTGAQGTTSSDTIGRDGSTSSCGLIIATGGGGGRANDGGVAGADYGESGQRMVSDTNARGGYGGGAGLINGSSAGQAAPLDSCTVCGGSGGNGASLTGSVGSNGVARVEGKRTGGNGGAYGGGGGGGSRRNPGGNGGNGAVRITYTTSSTTSGDSWNNVASNIKSTFISKSGRPPTITELRYWLNEYKNSSTLTLQQLITNINNSITVNAGPIKDNCGNTIN
jgi:hypothetical protein